MLPRTLAPIFALFACTPTDAPPESPTSSDPPIVVESEPPPAPARYPNELPGFVFHATAAWSLLVPLESTLADVRRELGDPTEARDLDQYMKPYPGDDAAIQPVLVYDISSEWNLLVYLVRSDLSVRDKYPAEVHDKLLSIELVPDQDLPFSTEFSPAWRSREVMAADAGWTTWADGSGLEYQIYRNGNLNRIVYGPSDEQKIALGMSPK
jgi:hypothetical protein